jgi:hypothetical protein
MLLAEQRTDVALVPDCSLLHLNLPVSVVRSSRDELLAAVDVVRRARHGCVAHDVNG